MKFRLVKNNTTCNVWLYPILILFIFFIYSFFLVPNKKCNECGRDKNNCTCI